jgi:hypothetical protein
MTDLVRLRRITKSLSAQLRAQLQEHLQTLTPLFRPKRILGECISGPSPESPPGAEKNFAALRQRFAGVAVKYGLAGELERPLPSIHVELVLHPWEYPLMIQAADGPRLIRVTTPTQWLLTYAGSYAAAAILHGATRPEGAVREFIVNALVLELLLDKISGLRTLFAALRFPAETAGVAALGDLGVTRIRAPIPSVRPRDELLLEAVELSGFPTFEETIDIDAARALPDPLRDQIEAIIQEHEGGGNPPTR